MSETVYTLIILIPVLLVSMSIHEMMHAFSADKLGDDTARIMGRISLNPLRHIDPFLTVALPALLAIAGAPIFGAAKPVQVNFNRVRYGEFGGAIIGGVGPLSNLVLALISAGLLHAFGLASGLAYDILFMSIVVNIGFFVFNSIPWPPLDGSRVLYAFAPRPIQEFMEAIEQFGLMGLVLFMLLFFQFLSPVITNIIRILAGSLL